MTMIDTAAAMAIGGYLVASLVGAAAQQARVLTRLGQVESEILRARQIEHLLDSAIDAARANPPASEPVAALTATSIVIVADRNRDGTIDPHSAERTTFRLRERGGSTALMHAIGRQWVTLRNDLANTSHLAAHDTYGAETGEAASVAVVSLALAPTSGASARLVARIPR